MFFFIAHSHLLIFALICSYLLIESIAKHNIYPMKAFMISMLMCVVAKKKKKKKGEGNKEGEKKKKQR